MLSYLNVRANIGLFHFYFSIRDLVPLLFTPPSPLIRTAYDGNSRRDTTCIQYVHVSYRGAGHMGTEYVSRSISVAPRLCQVQTMKLMYML